MKIIHILGSVTLICLGIFVFIYGGYDDSPGAQGLGLIVFVSGIITLVRSLKKK